ncbi:putative low-specificity L-threonine aldolase 2 [Armadillidium nasatum]|uniref:Putative low-specificity L-threonine aldolase 2 n=1 Tax=Armadillidium nasatum TaxID=96803 RepID=A0A5N5T6L0_9CRUS|nr:putative low-specificity L-threonine aldolase 2 [Armadillidium nasatum]
MDLPEFKDWLMEGMFPFHGYCFVCELNIAAGKSELLSHGKSKKHQIKFLEYQDRIIEDDIITAVVDEYGDTHLFHFIDLRSDSLSEPSKEMRNAMFESDIGDTSFGTDTPVKVAYKAGCEHVINMISKSSISPFPIVLRYGDDLSETISHPVIVADALGYALSNCSHSFCYPELFQRIRNHRRFFPPDFLPATPEERNLLYNHLFTMGEFNFALSTCNNGSIDPDEISYSMICYLHPSTLTFLLDIYNWFGLATLSPLSGSRCMWFRFQNLRSPQELEKFAADMLGKEDGLLFPTHIMANLAAGLAYCQSRGSAIIAGADSDITRNNREAFVKFGGLHFREIEENDDGSFSLDNLKGELEALDLTPPLSGLVTFECAHEKKGGRIPSLDWIDELGKVCIVYKCFLHCDGTRLINASLSKNVPLPNFVTFCDSITLALDKSLGAPVGAVLVGEKSFIEKARYIREFLGGNIHQAGTFAAAGLFGLSHCLANVDWDIDKAKAIALAVQRENNSIINVDFEKVETNIVHLYCNTEILNANQLKDRLASVNEDEAPFCSNESVIVLANALSVDTVSLMVHNKISHSEVKLIIQKLMYYY